HIVYHQHFHPGINHDALLTPWAMKSQAMWVFPLKIHLGIVAILIFVDLPGIFEIRLTSLRSLAVPGIFHLSAHVLY
ncbi:MAG: hypothetical protein WBO24_18685, partial [Nitrospirales bacterium]